MLRKGQLEGRPCTYGSCSARQLALQVLHDTVDQAHAQACPGLGQADGDMTRRVVRKGVLAGICRSLVGQQTDGAR